MLDLNDVYVLNDNFILRSIHDKFWCLDTNSGDQYRLNRVAYDILSELHPNQPISVAISNVSSKYKIAKDVFERDAIELLSSAIKSNIIRKEV